MLWIFVQFVGFFFFMAKAVSLLQQHISKFRMNRDIKLTPPVVGAARKYGLVEVQGPWKMEDRSLVVPRVLRNSQATTLYGVFDGHNGAGCSQYCVENLGKLVTKHAQQSKSTANALSEAFKELDAAYCSKEEHQSGSTACVVVVEGNSIVVANTGDSRAVLIREHSPKDVRAIALSDDHKPDRNDERERIARAGGMVSHWGVWRVEGVLAMSRVIGDKSLKKFAIPDPETNTRDIKPVDKFVVIGTDGVWDVLRNDEVANICAQHSSAQDAALTIMREIAARSMVDNTTLLVVDIQSAKAH